LGAVYASIPYLYFGWGRMILRSVATHAELLHFMGGLSTTSSLSQCTAGTGRLAPDIKMEWQQNNNPLCEWNTIQK
jgi:hypothetical protein